jgi:hypothetical protein
VLEERVERTQRFLMSSRTARAAASFWSVSQNPLNSRTSGWTGFTIASEEAVFPIDPTTSSRCW